MRESRHGIPWGYTKVGKSSCSCSLHCPDIIGLLPFLSKGCIMAITAKAIEYLEKTAQSVGFGSRDDYPFRGYAAVSAGDWKGEKHRCLCLC